MSKAKEIDRDEASPQLIYSSATSGQVRCCKWQRCGLSSCKKCSRYRSWIKAKNVLGNLSTITKQETTLFRLTFTIKNSFNLHENIRDIYQAFRKLRREPYWKENITGGIWFLHLNYNENRGWHPHFDCIIESKNLDLVTLKTLWCQETQGSTNVGFQIVEDSQLDHERLIHYQSKSLIENIHDKDKIRIALNVMKGKRKTGRIGTWLNTRAFPDRWKKRPQDEPQAPQDEPQETEDKHPDSMPIQAPKAPVMRSNEPELILDEPRERTLHQWMDELGMQWGWGSPSG